MGRTSSGRGVSNTDLDGCNSSLKMLRASGGRPPGFNLPRRGRVYRMAPEAHLLRECRRGTWQFWDWLARVGSDPAPGPTLKKPCAILVPLVGQRTNTA